MSAGKGKHRKGKTRKGKTRKVAPLTPLAPPFGPTYGPGDAYAPPVFHVAVRVPDADYQSVIVEHLIEGRRLLAEFIGLYGDEPVTIERLPNMPIDWYVLQSFN